jgi:hypothetical protein
MTENNKNQRKPPDSKNQPRKTKEKQNTPNQEKPK